MSLLEIILPPACSGCGCYGAAICDRCRRGFRRAARPADQFIAADPGLAVGDDLELALAAFIHEGALRRALARLKYGSAARLARPLAESAAPAMADLLALTRGPVLVPVPVHAERLRQRGYNQAGLIARQLARVTGLAVADVLVRTRPTTQQHRLGRAQRLRNLRAAFAIRAGARSPPQVILVDDILTTSATLEACAAVLRASGSERVLGVAIAREV